MRMVIIYVIYLVISAGLTLVAGRTLDRSGRAFMADWFGGNDALARAVSRLLILGYYLLSLGFVVLTMRTSGDIGSARQGMQLLSVKIGELLLVLGVLPLLILALFARLRRRGKARASASAASAQAGGSVSQLTASAKPANAR